MTLLMAPSVNPFVGPRSVRSGEPLYGRERELDELRDSLIADRVVLLFSPSGAGKSSLLEAGLRHEFEQERYSDRFFVAPTIRINQEAPGNRYVTSALRSLAEATDQGVDDDALSSRTLDEFVGEELSAIAGRRRVVLIFDQFEEVFTLDPVDVDAKREFFDQIGTMLRNRRVWAVIAMRDDYVGHLEPHLGVFPTRLSTRLRLDFLDERAALAAVQRPVWAVGVEFTDEAARLLVSDLRTVTVTRGGEQRKEPGPYVEPVQLQVVCSQLWSRLPVGTATITADDVRRLANTDNALGDFYADQVAEVARKTGVSERRIRDWFETRLITPQGFRSQEFEFPGTSGSAVLLALENCYLVRAETRRNVKWFELTHDRMIEPVLESNALWRSERLTPLQRLAADWDAGGRPPGMLVSAEVLVEAMEWLASASDATDAEREFVQESQRVQDAADAERATKDAEVRRARRRLASVAALTVMSVVSVAAIVAALVVWKGAVSDRKLANEATADAKRDRQTALEESEAASIARNLSEVATVRAKRLTLASRSRDVADPTDSLALAVESRRGADEAETAAAFRAAVSRFGRSPFGPASLSVPTGLLDAVSVAWSPDGEHIAVANAEGTVQLFPADGSSGSTPQVTGSKDTTSVSWSPSGTRIATANADGTLAVFDGALGTVTQVSLGPSPVNDVAFSSDGSRLAAISGDRRLRVIDLARLEAGEPAGGVVSDIVLGSTDPQFGSDPGWSVSWSSTNTIAAASYSGRMWLLDPSLSVLAPADPLGALIGWASGWSPSGDRLAVIDTTGGLNVYGPSLTPLRRTVSTGDGAGLAVSWSSGEQLVTGNDDGTIRVFDAGLAALGDPLPATAETVYDVAWNADGDEVAAVSSDSSLSVFPYVPLDRFVPVVPAGGLDVAVAPDGHSIAVTDAGGGLAFADIAQAGPMAESVDLSELGVYADWSEQGRLVVAGQDGRLRIVDLSTGATASRGVVAGVIASTAGPASNATAGVWAVEWSPDSSTVATANDDGTVSLMDGRTLEVRTIGEEGGSRKYDVTWAPDGKKLATVSEDRVVRVYDAVTGALLDSAADTGKRYGWAVAWSPDGKLIAEIDRDGTATIFDASTMDVSDRSSAGGGEATDLVWAPDSHTLVVADSAGSLRYLDVGEELREIVAPVRVPGKPVALEWVSIEDGDLLVVGLADGSVQVLSRIDEPAACSYTRRVLTPDQLAIVTDGADLGCAPGDFSTPTRLPLSTRRLPGGGSDPAAG